jgi:hypothetical protein
MKTLLWAFTALIATAWTGAVALAVQLTEWAIAELGSGRLTSGAWGQDPWPAPAWLTPLRYRPCRPPGWRGGRGWRNTRPVSPVCWTGCRR